MSTVKIKPISKKVHITLTVPGDKSITHRAIILGSISEGTTKIYGYLDADDTRRTIQAFTQLGVKIKNISTNELLIEGVGIDGLNSEITQVINCGNSGTTMRLLAGVLAGQKFSSELYGDESLSRRPMKRIVEPLQKMNIEISCREGNYPPIKIKGNPELVPVTYELPVPSAQVKSCILFAGMQAKGITKVIEPIPSRDHTERMLKYFDANLFIDESVIHIEGPVRLKSKEIFIPGDFSSAAFFIVAGILLKDAEIELKNVGLNPLRTGLINVLINMGAKIQLKNLKEVCNEPVGDIVVNSSKLNCISIGYNEVPKLIDEIPLIVLAATQADGKTIITGAKELRFKESDRIKTISCGLNKMGAKITELPDGFVIDGPVRLHGASVDSYNDHRIAMTLAIAALIADSETAIDNSECVEISFPDFWKNPLFRPL